VLVKENASIGELEEIKVLLAKGGLLDALVRDCVDSPWSKEGIGSLLDDKVDEKDQGLSRRSSKRDDEEARRYISESVPVLDKEDIVEELGWVSRLVHLFHHDDPDIQYLVNFINKVKNSALR
jgi:hypothetical protein